MKAMFQNIRLLALAILSVVTGRAHHQPPNFANIKALLLHLCDYDEAKCEWVLRWLAYPLRSPGAKMDMGLVVNGEAGTGKSLFFNTIMRQVYGDNSVRVLDASQLHAGVHRWAGGARLAVFEGPFSKKNATRLKELVTSMALQGAAIVGSGGRLVRKNRVNFVFLSTSSEFLPVLESDRRLAVLEVPPRHLPRFYLAVRAEIDNGGIDAFREYLMRGLDLGGFDQHTRPPADAAQRALAA
jgi:putative DNA primase/helicase